MSRVDENIVREYFEENGFLVRSVRRPETASRRKGGAEGFDLFVLNPAHHAEDRSPAFLLFASELPFIQRARVIVRTELLAGFTPAILKSGTRLLRFLEQNLTTRGELRTFGRESQEEMEGASTILVLPGLPTVEPHREAAVQLLRARGVDGIISFRSMLLEIVARVDVNRHYPESDVMEALRMLKNHDLIRDPQLELFGK